MEIHFFAHGGFCKFNENHLKICEKSSIRYGYLRHAVSKTLFFNIWNISNFFVGPSVANFCNKTSASVLKIGKKLLMTWRLKAGFIRRRCLFQRGAVILCVAGEIKINFNWCWQLLANVTCKSPLLFLGFSNFWFRFFCCSQNRV